MTTGFTDEIHVFQPSADDANNANEESACIGVLAFVESERLLIEVSEQVKGFHANVGATNCALQERPEVFHAVGMDIRFGVAHEVIDLLMRKMRVEFVIRSERIRIDRAAGFNVFMDFGKQGFTLGVGNRSRNDAAFAFQQSHDNGLANKTSTARTAATLFVIHLTDDAADVGFVNFNFARKLAKRPVLECQADSMQHKPRGFLCDTESAGKLTRTNAVLGVANHPEGGQPLVQTKGAFLENGADLHRRLFLTRAATVEPSFSHEHRVRRLAAGASHLAIGPANRGHEFKRPVVVSEVFNCLCECLRKFRFCFHVPKLAGDSF